MTKYRIYTAAAFAAVLAGGLTVQSAFALEPHFHMATASKSLAYNGAEPDAATTSEVHQLITAMGTIPPSDAEGNPLWPCAGGGGDADCSTISLGGVVIGFPFYTWQLTLCTSSTTVCGQIYWMFETDVPGTKEPVYVNLTVTQGTTTKTTIYEASGTAGTNPGSGYTQVIYNEVGFGPGNCMTGTCGAPVAGPATITVTTTIGKQRATGQAQIMLQ